MVARETEALSERIEAAFSEVEHPGDDQLVESTIGDEPAAVREAFRGETDWRAVSPELLDGAPDGWASPLAFLSDDAFVFYLPAFLMADLRGELSIAAPEVRLCWSLTPQSEGRKIARVFGGGTLGERARRCFDRLDSRQVVVVVDSLLWKLDALGYDDPAITQALDRYWLARVRSAPT